MQYSINLNQEVLATTSLDIIDAAILDYVYHLCSSVSASVAKQRMIVEGESWTWVNYKFLLESMPLLRIKSSGALTPRFKKLVDEGYIASFKHTNQRLYVCLLPQVDELFTKKNGTDKPFTNMNGTVHENEQSTVHENERTNTLLTNSNTKTHIPADKRQSEPTPIFEIVEYVTTAQGLKPFASKDRQCKAAKQILQAGYTVNEAKQAIKRMAEDSYWRDKTFDTLALARHITRYSKDQTEGFIDLDAIRAEREARNG